MQILKQNDLEIHKKKENHVNSSSKKTCGVHLRGTLRNWKMFCHVISFTPLALDLQ
jgi:hypothetical protein